MTRAGTLDGRDSSHDKQRIRDLEERLNAADKWRDTAVNHIVSLEQRIHHLEEQLTSKEVAPRVAQASNRQAAA
jgi:BMFP domain-containing protein YqiC